MPKNSGRTGNPGNDRVMRSVDVRMPHPELLQPGKARPVKLSSEVIDRGKVPSFKKGQFVPTRHKNVRSKGGY